MIKLMIIFSERFPVKEAKGKEFFKDIRVSHLFLLLIKYIIWNYDRHLDANKLSGC